MAETNAHEMRPDQDSGAMTSRARRATGTQSRAGIVSRPVPWWAMIVAAGLTLAATLPTAPGAMAQSVPLAGPYLAAEQAARRGDIAAAADYYTKALTADRGNAALLERAILHQVSAGRIETGVALSRDLVELNPESQIALLLLAADAFTANDPLLVLDLLDAPESESGPFVGYLIQAWAEYADGRPDAAREALLALRDGNTGGAAGAMLSTFHLGLLESALGDEAAAIEAFEATVERSGAPTDRLTRVQAASLARSGDVEGAIALIDGRLANTLGDPRLEALRADIEAGEIPDPMVESGRIGAAEALFGISGFLTRGQNAIIGLAYARLAVHLNPDLIDAKLLIAHMLRRDSQNELAIAAYESVPRDAPEALSARIGRAQSMQAAGKIEPAIIAMREVTARFPRSVEAHSALGDMLRQEERFGEAALAYDAAIRLTDPIEQRHWLLFYQRGISYERSDQWDLAETDFKKALELEPDQPLVLNYLGYSWVELRRNLTEAQEMIEKAVEQRPEDGYIMDSLGWVLWRTGQFEEAAVKMERAVELRPVDPVINDHYGDALWMIGRRTEARFQWKRALSFEPEAEEEARIRDKLKRGLDVVLEEEAAAGEPAIIVDNETAVGEPNDG
ncbi:MAG: tetratricopeptide repeat protein [Pseudomonadota bacterium]